MNRMTPWKKFISRLRELMGFNGDTIQVRNDMEVDGDLEVKSSFKANSLTDGTTTKTMTEMLAGGGGVEQEELENVFIDSYAPERATIDWQKTTKTGNVYTCRVLMTITGQASGFRHIQINTTKLPLTKDLYGLNAIWWRGQYADGNANHCIAVVSNKKYIYLKTGIDNVNFGIGDKVEVFFTISL